MSLRSSRNPRLVGRIANPHTVQIVTEGAERGIADLVRYGMPFAREEDGRISQRLFGAHTYSMSQEFSPHVFRSQAMCGLPRPSQPTPPTYGPEQP